MSLKDKLAGLTRAAKLPPAPPAPADEGSTLDLARRLALAGCELSASGGKFACEPAAPAELAPLLARHEAALLALLAAPAGSALPADWREEWSQERQELLRRAAGEADPAARKRLEALAGVEPADEAAWLRLGARVAREYATTHAVRPDWPSEAPTLSPAAGPYRGWMRGGPGEPWQSVCEGATWTACWRELIRQHAPGNCEKIVLPSGKHPDGRKGK